MEYEPFICGSIDEILTRHQWCRDRQKFHASLGIEMDKLQVMTDQMVLFPQAHYYDRYRRWVKRMRLLNYPGQHVEYALLVQRGMPDFQAEHTEGAVRWNELGDYLVFFDTLHDDVYAVQQNRQPQKRLRDVLPLNCPHLLFADFPGE